MDLLAVSPPRYLQHEARWIERLLGAGLHRYHLRKPGWPLAAVRDLVAELPEAVRRGVVLHQCYRLVEPYGLAGWHLRDRSGTGRAYQLLRKAGTPAERLSRSVHSIQNLLQSLEGYAYGILSPIFPSFSKPGHGPSWSESALRAALKSEHASGPTAKVYALGGISTERLAHCRDLGFAGVVLHGALWEAADPVAYLKTFQKGQR
ncbi:MAG: thiamine phosphate synthase [Puniceicoccaceae bacterium]|nr:MAG: thiamine phosphate synthase [Puniceicoccaceae bacterium]